MPFAGDLIFLCSFSLLPFFAFFPFAFCLWRIDLFFVFLIGFHGFAISATGEDMCSRQLLHLFSGAC
jgi:hypothetical protein